VRRPAQYIAAHEVDIGQVGWRIPLPTKRNCRFLDRYRLSGQRRFVQEQILGREHSQIGWDHIAGREPDDIAGNELLDRDLECLLACCTLRMPPQDSGCCPHHRTQPSSRVIRAMLLEEGKGHAQHHHYGDDRRGPRVAKEIRDRRQRQQQEIERVFGPPDQLTDDLLLALARDKVGANRAEPLRCRLCIETLVRRSELGQQLLGFRGSGIEQAPGNSGVVVAMRGWQLLETTPPNVK
jgi:hypothetical protein